MQEKAVEQSLREAVKAMGGKAYKFSSQIEAGMPDRLVCLPSGRAIFVETKRPKGGRLTCIQKYRHRELRRLGFEVRVINTTEAVEEFVREVRDGIPPA